MVGGENNSGAAEGTNQNLNIMNLAENPQDNQENVPSEVARFMGLETAGMNRDNAALTTNICPDMVDNDNQPLPENIPTEEEQATTTNLPQLFSSWGHCGSCYHGLEGGRKHKARLSFNTDVNPTIEQLFEMFFFKDFILKVILPEINKRIQEDKHRPVTYGEFLRWLGLWFLMATITGPDWTALWSMGEVDCFVGAPMRLGHFMSNKRFEVILKALSCTSCQPPAFRDRFWEVWEMLDAWNTDMTEQFTPSWVSCLDKSMSTWTNKYSCPGWMFVPQKPWPFGNEYHTVCCSLSGILWQMELVEGKDSPSEIVPKFNNEGKTVGLLLRVLEPIFAKGMTVILDSGFCVLNGIIKLKKRGKYASALIKKWKYWPKHIKGDYIKAHFNGKEVRDCDSWKGVMEDVPFHVYTMKEKDYVMSLMSTCGTNLRTGKETSREWVDSDGTKKNGKFNYPEVVGNHFLYQHSVDNHNNKRLSPISLEVVWSTNNWPNHVFSFLLLVTKVNVNLAATYICGQNQMGQVKFHKLLAQNLIYNTHYNEITNKTPGKKQIQCETGHCLIMLPKGFIFPKHKSSQQNVSILRTNALDARNECATTAYIPHVSFGVQNVSDIILHAPKTILQHPAE